MVDGLFDNLAASEARYTTQPRPEWLLNKDRLTKRSTDAAQINLLVAGCAYTREVEACFAAIRAGSKGALGAYNEKQQEQLSDLIAKTRNRLAKPDRQKVM